MILIKFLLVSNAEFVIFGRPADCANHSHPGELSGGEEVRVVCLVHVHPGQEPQIRAQDGNGVVIELICNLLYYCGS